MHIIMHYAYCGIQRSAQRDMIYVSLQQG